MREEKLILFILQRSTMDLNMNVGNLFIQIFECQYTYVIMQLINLLL